MPLIYIRKIYRFKTEEKGINFMDFSLMGGLNSILPLVFLQVLQPEVILFVI